MNDLRSRDSYVSPTATLNSRMSRDSKDKLSFATDSEYYDDLPELSNEPKKRLFGGLKRGESKKLQNQTIGYGWGTGSREKIMDEYDPGMVRRDSHSSSAFASTSTLNLTRAPPPPPPHERPSASRQSSTRTVASPRARPAFYSNDSSSTLVGSAFERKINDIESIKERVDTSDRLDELRRIMVKDNLDY